MSKLVPVEKPPATIRGSVIDTRYIDSLQAVYETIGGTILEGIMRLAQAGVQAGNEVSVNLDRQWLNWQILDRMRKEEEPCKSSATE